MASFPVQKKSRAIPAIVARIVDAPVSDVVGALEKVAGLTETRHQIPILANVLLDKRNGIVTLTTTDSETSLRTIAALGGDDRDAKTTVNARTLLSLMRSLPDKKTVSFEITKDFLQITCEKTVFSVRTMDATNFPIIGVKERIGEGFKLKRNVLRTMLSSIRECMGVVEVNHFFNGAQFETAGEELFVVGTDGKALATNKSILEVDAGVNGEIIPRKIVGELIKLLGDEQDLVHVWFAKGQLIFSFGGTEMVVRTLAGPYPAWRRVLPADKDGTGVAFTNRVELMQALERCSLIKGKEGVRGMRMVFGDGHIRFEASFSQKAGKGKEAPVAQGDMDTCEIEIDARTSGSALDMLINIDLVMGALKGFTGEDVRISISRGAVFSSLEDGNLRAVVMPMK